MKVAKIVLILFFSMSAVAAAAATHIIKFGGPLGKRYSPSSLTVAVGDTMAWIGNFDSHSLSLMKAPPGAAYFKEIQSGSSFR